MIDKTHRDRESRVFKPESIIEDPDTWTILLEINADHVSSVAHARYAHQHDMVNKSERHVTLIGSKTAETIKQATSYLPQAKQQQLFKELVTLASSTDFSFTVKPTFFHIVKTYDRMDEQGQTTEPEYRQTLVQEIVMPGLETFYKKLNSRLGTEFKTPWPHITLFSKSTNPKNMTWGIGIYSHDELVALEPKEI